MRPLPRPRPSPPAEAGIWLPCPVPASVGTYGARTAANLNSFRNCHFLRNDVSNHFTYILSLLLCPVPCLHFDCSLCLET
ncbi:unnamed protein product [Staurois parvus]|uniref:Uncharacterized protein n=1 Tax=Staurois parvus TaxID=386267 RepID=A0ABN9HRS5_9NEOB|nr:unnamed protein product [Staurois parvus]